MILRYHVGMSDVKGSRVSCHCYSAMVMGCCYLGMVMGCCYLGMVMGCCYSGKINDGGGLAKYPGPGVQILFMLDPGQAVLPTGVVAIL